MNEKMQFDDETSKVSKSLRVKMVWQYTHTHTHNDAKWPQGHANDHKEVLNDRKEPNNQ